MSFAGKIWIKRLDWIGGIWKGLMERVGIIWKELKTLAEWVFVTMLWADEYVYERSLWLIEWYSNNTKQLKILSEVNFSNNLDSALQQKRTTQRKLLSLSRKITHQCLTVRRYRWAIGFS